MALRVRTKVSHDSDRFSFQNGTGCKRALDCGAGIGRITKRVLLPIFDTVDMVELNQEFLDKAKSYLGENATRIGHYFCSGLQTFYPERDHYDVIWCQWVLGHLPDDDLVSFLQRCRTALTKNGIIVIKENIALTETPVFDDEDSSYTRPRNNLVDIIQQAGLVLLNEETQKDFPSDIFKVLMFAVQ